MYCKKCGNQINGTAFCPECGEPTNQSNPLNNTPQNKKNNTVKILAVIGGVVLGIALLFGSIFSITSLTSKKLVCKSREGNITIRYNNKTITGYTAKGITYDFDGQKAIAEIIGTKKYMEQFNEWFEANTTGTCTIK